MPEYRVVVRVLHEEVYHVRAVDEDDAMAKAEGYATDDHIRNQPDTGRVEAMEARLVDEPTRD